MLVSNRLPVSIEWRKDGLHFRHSVGGLVTGLTAISKKYKSIWVGWPGILNSESDRELIEKELLYKFQCCPVFLSEKEVEGYYRVFSNKTIWPLFHYFPQYSVYEQSGWKTYKKVNQLFAEKVLELSEPNDIIWIHDYHLMLLPGILRKELPDATIGFFLHIPFPSMELFCLLPCREELLRGLLGADLIGFHTYDYARHFSSSVLRLLGYEQEFDKIIVGNRRIQIDVFPMGVDVKKFERATNDKTVKREVTRIHRKVNSCKIILSIDRLDYTKGIPERLEAFELFLEKYPEWHKKVILILVCVPSRTRVKLYQLLKKRVDELVGRINGKYATAGWIPIWYLYRFLSFNKMVAYYKLADIALVTPLRDGMNLIAKEFIATKKAAKGVLILSELTGASKELGEALIVNPNHKEKLAETLDYALKMPEAIQIQNNKRMQRRLHRYNIEKWGSDFIDRLLETKKFQNELKTRELNGTTRDRLINHYHKSKSRLFLLDYDGTLVPFVTDPLKATPDRELLKLLKELRKQNTVVIISGRDRWTMEKWFGKTGINLIAEHGACIKEKRNQWKQTKTLTGKWKEQIVPVLELFTDRLPGSFVEEKEFSLVWHYRKAEPELARLRARELVDLLSSLTANTELQVLQGKKVVEIKNRAINKGRVALYWLSKNRWDFILGIGDDWTDEDLFEVLPGDAYSIKVGSGPSKSRFYLDSIEEVRSLLRNLEGG